MLSYVVQWISFLRIQFDKMTFDHNLVPKLWARVSMRAE